MPDNFPARHVEGGAHTRPGEPAISEAGSLGTAQAARLLAEFGRAEHESAESVLAAIIEAGEPFVLGVTVSDAGTVRAALAYAGEGVWTLTVSGLPAAMREVPEPARGSGELACCGGHRERCVFGRQHSWSRPWFEDGRVQRLATTYRCHGCAGVCTAEEGDCDQCGALVRGTPVTWPGDRLRRHWCSSACRDAALEEERQQADATRPDAASGSLPGPAAGTAP